MRPRTLRKIGWFFLRDLAIARSYRVVFLFEAIETLFGVAAFYYLSRFIEVPAFARSQPAGGYFAFAVVGFAFFDYMTVALNAFDQSLEEARRNGTLEYLLVTQTSLPVILAGSAIYPFVVLSTRTAVYLGWAVLLFNFPVGRANWAGAVLVLAASVLAFAGLGVLSASYSLLFKKGNPVKWLFLGVAGLVSGIMYPVTVLPPYLQMVARLVPVTYSLEGMRAAPLEEASLFTLWPVLRALLLFAVVLLPGSLAVFSWALRRTKVTGTLTHF
jgi:ABC-2 type transport system permease protein